MARLLSRQSSSVFIGWAAAALCVLVSFANYNLSVGLGQWGLLLSFCVLGMPHGMLDALILLDYTKLKLPKSSGIVVTYLIAALTVYFVWEISPGIFFILFLAATAFHWGSSEFGQRPKSKSLLWYVTGISRGCAIILTLFAFQSAAIEQILPFAQVHNLKTYFLLSAIASYLMHLGCLIGKPKSVFLLCSADLSFALLMIALCPPLLGITAYYTFFHSIRCLRGFSEKAVLPQKKKSSLWLTHGLSWLFFAAVLAFWLIFNKLDSNFEWQNLALGSVTQHLRLLSALTIPHLIFIHYLQSITDKLPVLDLREIVTNAGPPVR